MLERIVEWYNEMKLKVIPCEFDIVKNELEMIDNKLYIAYETARWCDYDEVYIILNILINTTRWRHHSLSSACYVNRFNQIFIYFED